MEIKNIGLRHNITVDAYALQKFNHVLNSKYNLEFTAFCHAEKRENSTYHIFDIFFPTQVNTATTTECDSENLIELMQDGADISMLAGHMHSHVNMAVFSSTTDEKDIIERAENAGFNAAIILNKKGEIFGHIADTELGIYVKKVPVTIIYPFPYSEFEEVMMREIRNQSSLDDMITMSRFTLGDYFDFHYPLSTEEAAKLDAIVKEKFSEPVKVYSGGKKNSGVQDSSVALQIPYDEDEDIDAYWDKVNNWESEGNLGIPTNPYDYFTVEEMAIIRDAENKNHNALTDMEWKLLQEYEHLYTGNSFLKNY